MTHLTPDELIDAVDGALAAPRRGHLDTCARCRQQAHALRAVLGDVRAVEVPEPSPLFWDHLSTRVRVAIANEGTAAPAPRWFHWPVLLPLAGLAALVMAIVTATPLTSGNTPGGASAPLSVSLPDDDDIAPQLADADLEWALLAELMAELDLDAVHDEGLATARGAADRALPVLTADEQAELIRLLQAELKVGS